MFDPTQFSGYGKKGQTYAEILKAERRNRATFKASKPDNYRARASRPILNQELVAKIKELQAADGIEDGFSFRYLQRAIFDKELTFNGQIIGSCVASGIMRSVANRCLAEITLLRSDEQLPGTDTSGKENNIATFAPFSYRIGRAIVGINGGHPSGNDDGSLVSSHVEGLQSAGALLCSDPKLLSSGYPEPNQESEYRAWGADDRMVNEFRDSEHLIFLDETDEVKNFDDALQAITSFKPVVFGADWAFQGSGQLAGYSSYGKKLQLWTRDHRDSWPHCMTVCGIVLINGQWIVEIENQWSNGGRDERGGPGGYHDGFWWFPITGEEFNAFLREASAFTIGEMRMKSSEQYAF